MLSSSYILRNRISFLTARKQAEKQVQNLPEIHQANKFITQLQNSDFSSFRLRGNKQPRPLEDLSDSLPESVFGSSTAEQKRNLSRVVDGAFATFALHIESRIANLVGKGYYTIGPCGEELLAPVGLVLRPTDPVALHYRHLAPSIVRRIAANGGLTEEDDDAVLKEILFDRAKGYTVSSTDPICGGHHCCLGGNDNDFLVTSTLASQSCPALGRAMGIPLAAKLLPQAPVSSGNNKKNTIRRKHQFENENILGDKHFSPFPRDAVSFVTLGDGSLNNGHFLSAMNLADYALHRKFKAPVVFCITDNDISISLRGNKFVDRFLENAARFPVFTAHGSDAVDTWIATHEAVKHARRSGRPQLLVLNDITRRFGHAATDRQNAYMTKEEIQAWQDRNPMLGFCKNLVEEEIYTPKELADRFQAIWEETKDAFDRADKEPKISTRKQVSVVNSAPLVDLFDEEVQKLHSFRKPLQDKLPLRDQREKKLVSETGDIEKELTDEELNQASSMTFVFDGKISTRGAKTHVMRKHMNKVFDEIMTEQRDVVYIGEDVTHGGYYLVTDGLHKKFPNRIIDFPPDETPLVGVGLGFSQAGMTPIVEIPYAKYLDCGFDMFTEACVMHWLSKGKEANGMIFRLQGFGRGVFGGNYHTHNMLHIPPGLDVVCCSRGDDYSKMMRYAIQQARAGRMIMFVDPTELLNLRDVREGCCWEFPYSEKGEVLTFDDVTIYRSETPGTKDRRESSNKEEQSRVKRVAIVTYGNGLVAALEADVAHNARILSETHNLSLEVDVIDCRLLSDVPQGLRQTLLVQDPQNAYDAILFADPCKFGQHPLGKHYQTFVNWAANAKHPGAKNLPLTKMKSIGAEFTYNPLGNKLTFLNASDIEEGLIPLLRKDDVMMN